MNEKNLLELRQELKALNQKAHKLDIGKYRDIEPVVIGDYTVQGYMFNVNNKRKFLKVNGELIPVATEGDEYLGINTKEVFSEIVSEIQEKIDYADMIFARKAGLETHLDLFSASAQNRT